MPTKQILNLGTGGVNYDTPKVLLPENVYSDVRNVRFKNQSVGAITGESRYAILPNSPNYGIHWRRPDGNFNVFIRDNDILVVDSIAAYNTAIGPAGEVWLFGSVATMTTCPSAPTWDCGVVTSFETDSVVGTYRQGTILDATGFNQSYIVDENASAYSNSKWQTTTFNGGYSIVLNNGTETPIYLNYNELPPVEIDPVTGLAAPIKWDPIPGWNYDENLSIVTKVIKPLGYSLVAANLTLTTISTGKKVYAPSTVRVSVQAAPGSFPDIWEPGLTTDTADEFELNTTSPILDMGELRGSMYIYAEDSIHMLSINTGVTRVQPYSSSFGILNTDCFVEFEGNHFVVDRNDIYIHNGSGNIESIATDRVREYFFSNINYSNSEKIFVKRDAYNREIWICYPKGESLTCNEALIYNYKNNCWSVRDLPGVTYIFNSVKEEPYIKSVQKNTMIMLTGTPLSMYTDDNFVMYDKEANDFLEFESYITKEKLNSGDLFGSNHITSLTPVFDFVPDNNPINIKVTGQNTFNTEVDWDDPRVLFKFKTDDLRNQGYKVDPRVTGRFLSYDIRTVGPWRLALIGIDAAPKDRR
jgi:hypothetical protein